MRDFDCKKQELLTEKLAGSIQSVLEKMGEDIKGLSWFSSIAGSYNAGKRILTEDTKSS